MVHPGGRRQRSGLWSEGKGPILHRRGSQYCSMFDAFVLRFELQQFSLRIAARASPPTAQSVACVYPCRLKPLNSVTYSRTLRREKPIRTKAVRQSTAYCDSCRLLLCSAVLRPTALAFLVGFPASADRSVDASVAFLLCLGPCRCPEQVLGRSIDRSIHPFIEKHAPTPHPIPLRFSRICHGCPYPVRLPHLLSTALQ